MKNKKTTAPKLRFPEFREAGEWSAEDLGDICQPQQWPTISSTDLVPKGYPVYGANGFIGYFTNFNHEFESVSVTCRGSTCGEVSLIPAKSYITGNSMCLDEIDASRISYLFIYHLLKHRGFNDVISGSAQPQIVGKAIRKINVALPFIDEQQKIAACLTSLDDLITNQSQKIKALQAHKKGLMQQLFPAEGETVPRVRFNEFREAGEWEEKILGQVAKYENGKAHEQDIAETGAFVVVNSKFISTNGEVRKRTNMPFSLAKKGDILMVLSDIPNGKAIAKCFFVDTDNLYTVNQRICKITSSKAVGIMLFYSLNRNPYFLSFDDGVKQTNLRNEDVLNCPIFLPINTKEQQKIADCLSSLDDLITTQSQKLEALKAQKKGLMQGIFPRAC